MARIGNLPEIKAIERQLDDLKKQGLVKEWELLHGEILTRLPAAVFFLTPAQDSGLDGIWEELGVNKVLTYRPNEDKKHSALEWRVEFSQWCGL